MSIVKCITRSVYAFVSSIFLILCASNTNAASFACSEATAIVERLICSDSVLSNLDDKLAYEYNSARKNTQDLQSLRDSQRAWLQKRNACGNNASCIAYAYNERISQLSKINTKSTASDKQAQISSPSTPTTFINANSSIAALDGNWYSQQWKYGYTLKNGVGIATSTNSPNFQVGQNIIRLTATSNTTFIGQQVYTDGKFYQVNVKLLADGRLYFEGEKNSRWVMERIGSPPQPASSTRSVQSSQKEVTDEAIRLIREKNFTSAEQLLRPLVAANNGYAQYLLGYVYESAPPPLRNHVTAVELYTKSANQGLLVAMHALGLAYDNARGVVKNEAYAIEMYTRAANQNFGRSQYALGLKYAQGSGVERNLDRAIDLLQKAANQKVAGAQQSLDQVRAAKQNISPQSTARVDNPNAVALDSDKNMQNFNSAIDAINRENYTLAEKILVPMAINGDAKVQYALAVVYERSLPPLQNYSKSFDLYSKAANSGDLDALYSLAIAYDEGRGTKKDEVQAAKLLIRAVDLGHRQAIVDLGLKYAEGRGVERNFDVAIEMLRKAWTQNVEGAGKAYASVMKMKEDLEAEARSKQILEQQRIAKIAEEERRLAKIEADRIANAERAANERLAAAEKARLEKIEAERNHSLFDQEYEQATRSRGRITFTELGYFRSQQEAQSALENLIAANQSTPFEIQTTKDGSVWRLVINNDVKHINDKDYEEKLKLLMDNLAYIQSKTVYKNPRLVSYTESTIKKIRKNTQAFTQQKRNTVNPNDDFGILSTIASWEIGFILLAIVLAFIPAFIGYARGHRSRHIILIICLFGSWTGILWLAALIWSLWPTNQRTKSAGPTLNSDNPECKIKPENQKLSNTIAQISDKSKDTFTNASTNAAGIVKTISNAAKASSDVIQSRLSNLKHKDSNQENASSIRTSPVVRAGWITLFIAWACMLIPIAGLGIIGSAIASASFFISIIAMFKGQIGIAVIQFVLNCIFSPTLYLLGNWLWFLTL